MPTVNFTTSDPLPAGPSVLDIPLAQIAEPKHLRLVLDFIANHATPRIAIALLAALSAHLADVSSWSRDRAFKFLEKIIRFLG